MVELRHLHSARGRCVGQNERQNVARLVLPIALPLALLVMVSSSEAAASSTDVLVVTSTNMDEFSSISPDIFGGVHVKGYVWGRGVGAGRGGRNIRETLGSAIL